MDGNGVDIKCQARLCQLKSTLLRQLGCWWPEAAADEARDTAVTVVQAHRMRDRLHASSFDTTVGLWKQLYALPRAPGCFTWHIRTPYFTAGLV